MTTRFTVTNQTSSDHGAGTKMAYGLGSHPGFAWPLPVDGDTGERHAGSDSAGDAGMSEAGGVGHDHEQLHVLEFEAPTPTSFRRLEHDLLLPDVHDTTAELRSVGALLPVNRSFFDDSAILFPDIPDTAIVYRRIDGRGPRIRMSWTGFDTLTLWSPPDGDFLCIEPWAGRPQEAGATTPDSQREDVQHLSTGESRTHEYRLDIG